MNKYKNNLENKFYFICILLILSSTIVNCGLIGSSKIDKAQINKKIKSLLSDAKSESNDNIKARLYGEASELLAEKGDISKAVDAARKGRRANPMEPKSLATIGEYYISQKRYKEARLILEEALGVKEDSTRINYLLANASFADNQSGSAIEYYNTAIELDSKNVNALTNLAALYVTKGQAGKAVGLLEQAIAVQPGFAENYKNAGIAADKAGNKSKAKDFYTKYLELNKSGDDRQVVEAWIAKLN